MFDDNLLETKSMVALGFDEDKKLPVNLVDTYTAIEMLAQMIEEERIVKVCTKYKTMVKNVKRAVAPLLDDSWKSIKGASFDRSLKELVA